MAQARKKHEPAQRKQKPKVNTLAFWHPESKHAATDTRVSRGFIATGCLDILERGHVRAHEVAKLEFSKVRKNPTFIGSLKRAFQEVTWALQVEASDQMDETLKEETINNRFIAAAEHFDHALKSLTPANMFPIHLEEHVGVAMAKQLFEFAKKQYETQRVSRKPRR